MFYFLFNTTIWLKISTGAKIELAKATSKISGSYHFYYEFRITIKTEKGEIKVVYLASLVLAEELGASP